MKRLKYTGMTGFKNGHAFRQAYNEKHDLVYVIGGKILTLKEFSELK